MEAYKGDIHVTDDSEVLEAWTVSLGNEDENVGEYTLRYRLPENKFDNCRIELYRLEDNGNWEKIDAEDFGNYAGFNVETKTVTFCAVQVIDQNLTFVYLSIPVVVLLIIVLLIIRAVKKKKKKAELSNEEAADSNKNENNAEENGENNGDSTAQLEKQDDTW